MECTTHGLIPAFTMELTDPFFRVNKVIIVILIQLM